MIEHESLLDEQRAVFWEVVDVFDKLGLLPFVMLMGSWSEYIYQHYYLNDFRPHIMTRDVDFLYRNLSKPGAKIELVKALEAIGFSCEVDRLSGIGKFIKEDVLAIEFLVRVLGKGDPENRRIPSLGVTGIGLRDINMLDNYPLYLDCDKYTIIVPEPEAYILQKLLINPKRKDVEKREKDMRSIQVLIPHISKDRINEILDNLTKKQQNTITDVCKENFVTL